MAVVEVADDRREHGPVVHAETLILNHIQRHTQVPTARLTSRRCVLSLPEAILCSYGACRIIVNVNEWWMVMVVNN
jgi:hypothetical protein